MLCLKEIMNTHHPVRIRTLPSEGGGMFRILREVETPALDQNVQEFSHYAAEPALPLVPSLSLPVPQSHGS